MSEKYDAIIIGAGIIGCCTAFELAQKGYRTLNVDKLPAAGYGSTSNSCAVIRLHYSTSDGVAIARESYFYWLDWEKYLGVTDPSGMARYINYGCLVIKTAKNKFLKNVMNSMDDLGVAYEELDSSVIKKKYPFLDIRKYHPPKRPDDPEFGHPTGDAIVGAIFVPESGFISDPQLSTHNVQTAAETHGAQFLFNAQVTAIRKKKGRVCGITLKNGRTIDAPIIINVAGPHSFIINRLAGVEQGMNIKTRALRQEVAHVPAPEGWNYETDGTLISDGDIGCYSRPEVGNHILIGSEEPDCDTLDWVDDPDNYDLTLSDRWSAQVMREAQRIRNLPIPNQKQGLVDLYDVTDDWIPIYDKSDLPGFYMAVGTSGNQYKNAPVVGKMMAHLIEQTEAGCDHDITPVQFPMAHTRRSFNMAFFSRLRQINPNSSFSVIG